MAGINDLASISEGNSIVIASINCMDYYIKGFFKRCCLLALRSLKRLTLYTGVCKLLGKESIRCIRKSIVDIYTIIATFSIFC
jgi:hypothetical protein